MGTFKDYFLRDPGDLFYLHKQDRGLSCVEPIKRSWVGRKRGKINDLAASRYDHVNALLNTHIRRAKRLRAFSRAIEFEVIACRASHLSVRNRSFVSIGDKFLLNGATGMRLLNNYCASRRGHVEADQTPDDNVDAALSGQQTVVSEDLIPFDPPVGVVLDFVIDAKNFFNFYHFTTETLHLLIKVSELANQVGPIKIVAGQSQEIRKFVQGQIDFFFPEFADRIDLVTGDYRADDALMMFNPSFLYCQTNPDEYRELAEFARQGAFWKTRRFNRLYHNTVLRNSYPNTLRKLRHRALERIAATPAHGGPKRLYMGRKKTPETRARGIEGEEALIEMLKSYGFEFAYFEDYDIQGQIDLLQSCEILIAPHGAGLTNMLFVPSDTTVVEIGNISNALHTWSDFISLAHVARCKFTTVFADVKDHEIDPNPNVKLAYPTSLSQRAIDAVEAIVLEQIGGHSLPHTQRSTPL